MNIKNIKKQHSSILKTNKNIPKNIDLLIIDIDDTFIYHRTVAAANRLFLENIFCLFGRKIEHNKIYTTNESLLILFRLILLNFFRIKIKKEKIKRILILSKAAIILHFLNIIRIIKNRFLSILSNEKMIRIWAKTIVSLKIKKEEYYISKKVIEENLNKKILTIYESLKKLNPRMYVLAMSQSFSIDKDPIKDILKIDIIESNKFRADKKGIISGFELKVKNAKDKKQIADNLVIKIKPKNIALFADDYDDVLLLGLKNLKFIVYRRMLKRFLSKRSSVIRRCFNST